MILDLCYITSFVMAVRRRRNLKSKYMGCKCTCLHVSALALGLTRSLRAIDRIPEDFHVKLSSNSKTMAHQNFSETIIINERIQSE
jgi:hypothetical protein